MTVKETELQKEMLAMVQKTTELKEEFSREKNRLTEDLKLVSEEMKSRKVSFSVTDSLHSDNSCALSPCLFLLRPSVMY